MLKLGGYWFLLDRVSDPKQLTGGRLYSGLQVREYSPSCQGTMAAEAAGSVWWFPLQCTLLGLIQLMGLKPCLFPFLLFISFHKFQENATSRELNVEAITLGHPAHWSMDLLEVGVSCVTPTVRMQW